MSRHHRLYTSLKPACTGDCAPTQRACAPLKASENDMVAVATGREASQTARLLAAARTADVEYGWHVG